MMSFSDITTTLPVSTIIIQLLGGLALFLFGMEQMTDALKLIAGSRMKELLARLTTNPFKAVFAGTVVTAIIQSSSVTTVLVVSFITAGLLTLKQSLGIILGADIGTTITAQIIAFKVTQYALVLIAVGFLLLFVAKRPRVQQYGSIMMGLGLIFLGMELMSDATRPLRTFPFFIDLMKQMDNPVLGVLVGTLFTGIIQSSAATLGLIIVLAGQGLITLEAGIALTFGANIGTCVTALLAAIGKPREAVQAAFAHIFFKIIGVLLWFAFIGQLATVVRFISPSAPNLEGVARMAAEAPRQIANAHTLFNVVNTFIFVWFTNPLIRLLNFLVPERTTPVETEIHPRYLDPDLLETPELALDRVRLELDRLGYQAVTMVQEALPAVFCGSMQDLALLAKMDDNVDTLHNSIVAYLGKLSRENMLQKEAGKLTDYMAAANYIESIGDMVETNLVEAGSARLQHNVSISAQTQEALQALHNKVVWAVEGAVKALVEEDHMLAEEVMAAKLEINRLANEANTHVANRLTANAPHRLELFNIETEIIEYLKRVYYFAKRIAKIAADADLVYTQVVLAPAAKT